MRVVALVLLWLAAGVAAAGAQEWVSPETELSAAAASNVTPQARTEPAKAEPAQAEPANAAAEPEQHAAVAPEPQADDAPAAKPADVAAPPVEDTLAQIAALIPDDPAVDLPDTLAKLAVAPSCPGHPDAIGTSRVVTISPDAFRLLGTIQYKHTLPLRDHEVVLTFDDGPIPPYTTEVLATLAANCVKATYFMVGEMAKQRPNLVRRVYNEGHSIGTHTQHHPLAIQRMSMGRVEREVDGGIETIKAALGDPKALSPFFRIPGLGRTDAIESFLGREKLVTWSADIDPKDWFRGTSASAIIQRTMSQLKRKGRGIILMHDIHPATVRALPMLLKELKKNGYRIVHVVAAGERPESLPLTVAMPLPPEKPDPETVAKTLHAKAEPDTPAKPSLRQRVKHAVADRPQRQRTVRYRKPKTAANPVMNRSNAY